MSESEVLLSAQRTAFEIAWPGHAASGSCLIASLLALAGVVTLTAPPLIVLPRVGGPGTAPLRQTRDEKGAAGNCFTKGASGVGAGHPCVFPVVYNGVEYSSCTSANYNTLWCATQTSNGTYVSGLWGDCMCQVRHIHLALTGDSTEMLVQWTADVAGGVVEYAPKDSLWNSTVVRSITGSCHTYHANDMCEAPATISSNFVDPGQLCEAVVAGLTPDADYMYRISIGSDIQTIASSFRAAPDVHPEYSFTYLVYGDMGTSAEAYKLASLCSQEIKQGSRMTHHFGDLSYARGYATYWDAWMALIEPYAKAAPYMVGIGNHEFDYMLGSDKDPSGDTHFQPSWFNGGFDSGGECGVPSVKRFHMPAERSAGNSIFWHSYDFGSLHTIMLSSEHSCGEGSAQHAWLAKDLAGVDRMRTPWLVVELHRPMYNNEQYLADYNVAVGFQRQFEDLLIQYGVDLVLAGHYHSYLRSKRIYKDRADEERGVYHFTIGSAGGTHDGVGLYDKDWVEFFDTDYGFGRITIKNSSVMHWERIRNDAIVVDEAWITNKHHGKVLK